MNKQELFNLYLKIDEIKDNLYYECKTSDFRIKCFGYELLKYVSYKRKDLKLSQELLEKSKSIIAEHFNKLPVQGLLEREDSLFKKAPFSPYYNNNSKQYTTEPKERLELLLSEVSLLIDSDLQKISNLPYYLTQVFLELKSEQHKIYNYES